jgi:hypothetical protein
MAKYAVNTNGKGYQQQLFHQQWLIPDYAGFFYTYFSCLPFAVCRLPSSVPHRPEVGRG